jgi:hypothetical protein
MTLELRKSRLLGIFQTKKAQYNKLILKSLVTGPKTTNQIAEYIFLNRRERTLTERKGNEIKKIVSIISRKDSRLDELETKQYIHHKDNLRELTPKGMGVALTFFDSITEIFPYVKPFLHSIVEDLEKNLRENPMLQSLGRIEKRAFQTSFDLFESPEFLQFLKDLTNELIRQGIDLDKTSLKEFISMLMGKFFVVYLPKIIMGISPRKEGVRP